MRIILTGFNASTVQALQQALREVEGVQPASSPGHTQSSIPLGVPLQAL